MKRVPDNPQDRGLFLSAFFCFARTRRRRILRWHDSGLFEEDGFGLQRNAELRFDARRDFLHEAQHVFARCAAVIDEDESVVFANTDGTRAVAFEARLLDQPSRREFDARTAERIEAVAGLLDHAATLFDCTAAEETTLEANPDDLTPAYLAVLRRAGVNRLSVGIQSFDDACLKLMNRRHNAAQAVKAVETIRRAGIDNISIDLMFGFPDETLDDWQNDLNTALKLRPNHISAYSLMYEEGTPLYLLLQNGKIKQPDDDTCLAMYTMLMDTLSANGYEHYEISNFCLPGYRAIHNSSYWNDTPYLGFGAAAHSYNLLTRSWNVADIKEYINTVGSSKLPSDSERIDDDTHYDDIITTAMRTHEGVDLKRLKPEYRDYALRSAKSDIDGGLLELTNDHLRLTRKGLFVSDMVMSNLMKV